MITARTLIIVIALHALLALPAADAQTQRGAADTDAKCDSLCITPTRTISFETSQGTQVNVDVSPDGETILFDLLGDLYTVPRNGGAATRLTYEPTVTTTVDKV